MQQNTPAVCLVTVVPVIIIIIIIILDRFYIALFSALEQTHCDRMRFYMNDYIIVSIYVHTALAYS